MSSYDAVKVKLAMDSLREALDSESTYAALMLAFNSFKSKAQIDRNIFIIGKPMCCSVEYLWF